MTPLTKQLEDKKEHEHNFIDTNVPDEQMLCGFCFDCIKLHGHEECKRIAEERYEENIK